MKRINWLDHTANLLVVILGISIAFYLEGWREETANKKQERKYLDSLITDLNTDVEALDTLRIVNEMIIKASVSLANATVGQPYEDATKLRSDVLMIQYNPPFVPQRTVYESMKSSGRMDLINDFKLRNQIVELYEQYYRGTGQYDQSLDEHVRDFIKPFFMKNIQFTSGNTVDDAFLKEREFQNMIFSYRYLFVTKDSFYGEVKNKAIAMKEAMEKRLERL